MNQKEAHKNGLCFGASNAQKLLKRIREHVLWSDQVTLDEWRVFDEAMCLLEPISRRHEALWRERVRVVNEDNRRRHEERLRSAS